MEGNITVAFRSIRLVWKRSATLSPLPPPPALRLTDGTSAAARSCDLARELSVAKTAHGPATLPVVWSQRRHHSAAAPRLIRLLPRRTARLKCSAGHPAPLSILAILPRLSKEKIKKSETLETSIFGVTECEPNSFQKKRIPRTESLPSLFIELE